MPSTQGGSEPRPGDLRKTLREGKRNEKMLFEAMTKRPKVAAVAAAPGVQGNVEVHSTSRTVDSMSLRFHTWGGVVQGDDTEAPPIAIDFDPASPSRFFGPSEAGYYSAKVDVQLVIAKAGAPTRIRLEVNEAAGAICYFETVSVQAMWSDYDASHYSVRFRAPSQVFYLPKWYMYPRLGVLLYWANTGTPSIVSASCDYYLTRVA